MWREAAEDSAVVAAVAKSRVLDGFVEGLSEVEDSPLDVDCADAVQKGVGTLWDICGPGAVERAARDPRRGQRRDARNSRALAKA